MCEETVKRSQVSLDPGHPELGSSLSTKMGYLFGCEEEFLVLGLALGHSKEGSVRVFPLCLTENLNLHLPGPLQLRPRMHTTSRGLVGSIARAGLVSCGPAGQQLTKRFRQRASKSEMEAVIHPAALLLSCTCGEMPQICFYQTHN